MYLNGIWAIGHHHFGLGLTLVLLSCIFELTVAQTFINKEHKYLSLPGLQVWSDHMIKIFFVKMYMQPECYFYLLAKTMRMLTLKALTKNEPEKMLPAQVI